MSAAKKAADDTLTVQRRDRLTRLKQQIARREYRVDAEAVAREMVFKMRMVNTSRRALLQNASGSDARALPPTDQ